MIRNNLNDKVFGKLTVLCLAEVSRNGHTKWNVVCSCGTEKVIFGTHLLRGNTTSCGCDRPQPRNWGGVGKLPKTYFSSLKLGAMGGKGRKPIEFNITMEYLWDLYILQDGKCVYTNLPISFRAKTASVDRIDSSVGYIEGNVQWTHKDVNMMKRHYSETYFKKLCQLVTTGGYCEVVDL